MAEGREQEIRAVAPDRADDVADIAGRGVGAFHEREIAIGRGPEQRLKIGAGVIGNAHRAPRLSAGWRERAVEPAISVDPGDRLAGGEIEHMGAAAERVDARPRASVGPLEAPAAGEGERLGAAKDEQDHLLRIAGDLVANPQLGAAVLGLNGEKKAVGRHVLPRGFLHEDLVEIERAGSVVGRADIEHA